MLIAFADEASISLQAYCSKGYAPKGQPPVIVNSADVKKRLHTCSAITSDGRLVYTLNDYAYNGDAIVDFLKHFLKQIQQSTVLIWDGASIHRCQKVKNFLSEYPAAQRLHLIQQPPYCPELNADEQVWNYLKTRLLVNRVWRNLKQLRTAIKRAYLYLIKRPHLIKSFFQHPLVGMKDFILQQNLT